MRQREKGERRGDGGGGGQGLRMGGERGSSFQ